MTRIKDFECAECGAVYTLNHELEPTFFTPRFCAFCGEELDSDNLATFDDVEESEED